MKQATAKELIRGLMVVTLVFLVLTLLIHFHVKNATFFLSLLVGGVVIVLTCEELRRPAGLIIVGLLLSTLSVLAHWVEFI